MVVMNTVLVLVVFVTGASCRAAGDANPTGKAIYTSPRNPISTYFKEHKNKLRPYLKPETGITVHDETSGTPSYSNYYESGSSYDSSSYPSSSSLTSTKDESFGSSSYMDSLYESSNPVYEASNAVYSMAEPDIYSSAPAETSGNSQGYYNVNSQDQTSYSQPSYTSPVTDNIGYYGNSDSSGHVHQQPSTGYHEETYSNPPSALPQASSYPATQTYAEPEMATPVMEPAAYHHTPTREHEIEGHHEPSYEPAPEMVMEPAHHEVEDDDEGQTDPGYAYDYQVVDEEDMIMEKPKPSKPGKPGKPGKPSLGSLLGGGGGGAASPAPPAAPTPPVDNPLSFLNLVGTDFQPGRLVNIFFGLFIMLFMIITHGYALWILGIAYLPGTRSLNDWQIDTDKVNGICDAVLDALEYWGNRVD